jgi:hypothetical protein
MHVAFFSVMSDTTPYNARTLDSSRLDVHLNFPLVSSPGLGTPPFVRGVPKTLVLGSSKKTDVCARDAKIRGHVRSRRKNMGIVMLFMYPCIHIDTFSLRSRDSGPVKVFFVSYADQLFFPGLLVSGDPRKMLDVTERLDRLVRHVFSCSLSDGFRVHPF